MERRRAGRPVGATSEPTDARAQATPKEFEKATWNQD